MNGLTKTGSKRIEQVPPRLKHEFPQVPLDTIEQGVEEHVRRLIVSAHFDDYVPLLVHRAVRERLRAIN